MRPVVGSTVGLSRTLIVKPITAAAATAPIISPICWYFGVAPTRKPVLRSWLVAPALAAAMQTIPPTQRAIGWQKSAVQPIGTNSRQAGIRVGIVISKLGLEQLRIIPTMGEGTVTKKKAKTISRKA